MASVVLAPKISPNDDKMVLVEWMKEKGTFVRAGEAIAIVEGSKTAVEFYAEVSGYIFPLKEAGETVAVLEVIAVIVDNTTDDIDKVLADYHKELPGDAPETSSPGQKWTKKAEILARRHGIDPLAFKGIELVNEAEVLKYVAVGGKDGVPGTKGQGKFPRSGPKRLGILGAGLGVIQLLETVERLRDYKAVAIFDDNAAIHNTEILGCPVVGGIPTVEGYYSKGLIDCAVMAINNNIGARDRIFSSYLAKGIPFCNIIDPTVLIHGYATIGLGNVIMANSRIGQCARVGNNNFLSAYVNIEHHNVVGDGCTFGPGVLTSGEVRIGNRVRFGTGVFVEPKVSIGSDCIISSGAILTNDVPEDHIVKTVFQPKIVLRKS